LFMIVHRFLKSCPWIPVKPLALPCDPVHFVQLSDVIFNALVLFVSELFDTVWDRGLRP
jgi:hypothetical protein